MKTTVLNLLRENSEHISGEEISKIIGVTRAAVWKSVKKLQEEGYVIESKTKLGYKLIEEADVVTSDVLRPLFENNNLGQVVHYEQKVDSTNEVAKKLARNEGIEGTIVIADIQESGKGRLGRTWISPPKTGIWMSIILKPEIRPQYASQLTLLGGMCMCMAIRNITKLDAQIKWPNDIVIGNKKVCGILTEMSAEMERINYIVLGIGVNVNQNEFDSSIPHASSLKVEGGMEYKRSEIIKEFIDVFEEVYEKYKKDQDFTKFLPLYKSMCITLDKEVKIIEGNKESVGYSKDISKDGDLIVTTENGEDKSILSGEVSVRGLYGYI